MDPATPLLPQQDTSLMHRSFMNSILSSKKYLYIVMGPLGCFLICLFADMGVQVSAKNMLGAIVWIFIWWLTEAVPVPVTSMAPLYLLPLLGITSADAVAKCYMDDVVALVIGSFILAIAVEHYNIHQRLALNITLLFCGDPPSPRLLLLGICGTTMFISFWMQNIAAAVMMMPVATGILQRLPAEGEVMDPDMVHFSKAMVLGVMYSAAIGGIATLTGTGVNLITVGVWATSFPEEKPISFSSWFFFGFPIALLMFLALWGILCFLYCSKGSGRSLATYLDRNHLQRELQKLGPMVFAEKMILSVFCVLVVLWMTRSLTDDIPGWGILFNDNVGDGTVSVMVATLLFIIPNMKQKGEKLMDWDKCKKLQWNVVLLLGAGFAIADGVQSSGLADMLSASLSFLSTVPYFAVAPIVCLISGIITEFTSNNATATLVLPVLIQLAKTMGVHPLILMIPGAIGAQFAYWLPTGTPPNLVGFATGHIGIVDMFKTGIPLKMIGIVSVGFLMPTLGVLVFGTTGEKPRDM